MRGTKSCGVAPIEGNCSVRRVMGSGNLVQDLFIPKPLIACQSGIIRLDQVDNLYSSPLNPKVLWGSVHVDHEHQSSVPHDWTRCLYSLPLFGWEQSESVTEPSVSSCFKKLHEQLVPLALNVYPSPLRHWKELGPPKPPSTSTWQPLCQQIGQLGNLLLELSRLRLFVRH